MVSGAGYHPPRMDILGWPGPRRRDPSHSGRLPATPRIPQRTALVLGGGGLKGFAHIGVLRALDERGVKPTLYAGTSVGALIASARVAGMSPREMAERAGKLRKQDLFRVNHMGMVLKRMRCPSLYSERPLRTLCEEIAPAGTFSDLRTPLLVSTVEVARGRQVVWGLPGLRDVKVADAVYASCAFPGLFPPGRVGGVACVDGATMDNLPAVVASHEADAVIAVDLGHANSAPTTDGMPQGFAAIYARAAQVMMHTLQTKQLADWAGPPLLLIRPAVWRHESLSFPDVAELVTAGYRAASAALDEIGDALLGPGGVYPQRLVQVTVNRDKCVGCTACVAHAPRFLAMDRSGKAYVKASPIAWSHVDEEIIHQCPTRAISVRPLRRRTSGAYARLRSDAACDAGRAFPTPRSAICAPAADWRARASLDPL